MLSTKLQDINGIWGVDFFFDKSASAQVRVGTIILPCMECSFGHMWCVRTLLVRSADSYTRLRHKCAWRHSEIQCMGLDVSNLVELSVRVLLMSQQKKTAEGVSQS